MSQLPPCDYRVATEQVDAYFCRHTRVKSSGDIVNGSVCQMCRWHAVPCPQPRDIPDAPLQIRRSPRAMPSLSQRAWNLTGAIKDFAADGMKTVTKEQYAERLAICDECEERRGNWCRQCGCFLALKAKGRTFGCPLDKWPTLARDASSSS